MATDIEKLVVQLSADFKSFEKSLARANGVSNKQFNAIERRALQMNKKLDGVFANSFKGLAAPLAGVAAALGVGELIRLTNVWTDLTSRVDLAAGSMEKGADVMARLQEMARRTYSGLEQTAESYLLNARTLTELGYSTKTQLDYTESLNNALVVSGAKGDRAASVMNALSKAMALGKLSGDDLNTVISTGGRVAQALADSMGVSTLQLRKLGSDGKITRKELVGITSQLAKLRVEADGMQATIGDASQILKDALLAYVGGGDQAVGVSARLAEAILLVADNFKVVADAGLQLAFVIASALMGRAISGMIATMPSAVAAVTTLVTALRAGTLTAAGFTAALGPIGIAAGIAAASLYLLSSRQSEAEEAAELHESTLKILKTEVQGVDYANQDAVASTRSKIDSDVKAAEAALTRAEAELNLASALKEVRDQTTFTSPTPGNAIGFNVNTSVLPTGVGQNISRESTKAATDTIVSGRVETAKKTIEEMKARVEEFKSVSAEFEDYASGRKKPPVGEVDRPISLPDDDKKKKAKKTRENEFQRELKSISDRTAAMVAETEAQRQINPLVEDYGYAIEKARAQQDLLNAAQEAGVKITPELRAEIGATAEQFAIATVEAGKLAEAQDKVREKAEEMADFQKDLARGMVDGFLNGASAAEILADSLTKVGNKLLDMAFDGLFNTKASGGSGFNPLGFLADMFRETGGPVKKGQPYIVGEKRPELFVPNQNGKIVPRVPSASALQAPTMPRLQAQSASSQGASTFTFAPQIDARGASVEAVARLEQVVAKQQREFEARAVNAVRKAQKGNVKLS